MAEVAAIIEKNMAMSAKVLQFVNSAFFGMFQLVENPARAVGLPGLETINGLVRGVQLFDPGHNNVGADLIGLWGRPIPVIEAIAFHHCLKGYPETVFNPVLAVHAANALYHKNKAAEGIDA
jgi:HD-like signal output (HDOD) protein